MILEFRLARAARTDLVEIWCWTAERDADAADRLIDRIHQLCTRLLEQPELGRPRPELHPDLRSFPVGHYLVFYRVLPTAVEVVRVLHGHRDLGTLL